jgi:hypothetical protein
VKCSWHDGARTHRVFELDSDRPVKVHMQIVLVLAEADACQHQSVYVPVKYQDRFCFSVSLCQCP